MTLVYLHVYSDDINDGQVHLGMNSKDGTMLPLREPSSIQETASTRPPDVYGQM